MTRVDIQRMVAEYLHSAGIAKEMIEHLIENPLVDIEGSYTPEQIAETLLSARIDPELPLDRILLEIGFKTEMQEKLFRVFEGLIPYYGHIECAEMAIEWAFGNVPRDQTKDAFPFEENNVAKFFTCRESRKGFIYNMRDHTPNMVKLIRDYIIESMETSEAAPKRNLLFHGTCWEWAKSICNKGILLREGRKNLDFGSDRAFYLTDNLDAAIAWCGMRNIPQYQGQAAIVVYAYSKEQAIADDFSWLSLSVSRLAEWQGLVHQSRRGEYEDDETAFISGPVLRNPRAVTGRRILPSSQLIPHKFDQVACRIPRAAKKLNTNLIGTIYLSQNASDRAWISNLGLF